jgi:ABC-type uncharacterized transport system fused permease/ATPase subunit
VLIRPPDILIMDEPTSSLDELSQFRITEYVRDLLPDAMVIHAGHRSGFHDREIKLVREKRHGPGYRKYEGSYAYSPGYQRCRTVMIQTHDGCLRRVRRCS